MSSIRPHGLQHVFVFTAIASALLLLPAERAAADISPISQTRSVRYGQYMTATAFGQSQGFHDIDNTVLQTAVGFSGFDVDMGSSFTSGGAGASQHSTISTTSITGRGFTYAGTFEQVGNIYETHTDAAQTLSVAFSVASAQPYTVTYNAAPGISPATDLSDTVTLSGPGGAFLSFDPVIINGAGPGASYTGTLAPGTWTLEQTPRSQHSNNFTNFSYWYDWTLTVPEPSAMALLLCGGMAMSFRRHRHRAPDA